MKKENEGPAPEKQTPADKVAPSLESILKSFDVNQVDCHAIPCKLINSRLCHSLIWGGLALKSNVVILLLKISRSSRAFVITQNAFPAFTFSSHNNIFSLMFDYFDIQHKR